MDGLIGKAFGSYSVVERIGQGGMAEVYKGYQASLNRYVAIKVLRGDLAHDQEFVTRFHREALAVAKLSHPNILHVYDTGVDHGVYYIAMDYAEGGTLMDLIRRGPIEIGYAISIVTQVAGALDYAHREGLVHRDVKPSNILLTRDGRPLLTDFGIARAVYEATQLTRTGTSIGTPEYMAPEQAQGLPPDGRADIYALGIVLYEMLAGTVPFRADTPVATMYKHVHEPLPPLRRASSSVPAWLEAAVLKALAKRPEDRFQRASAFSRALRQSQVLDATAASEGGKVPALRELPVSAPGAGPRLGPGAGRSRVPPTPPRTPPPREVRATTPPPRPPAGTYPGRAKRRTNPMLLLLGAIAALSLVVVVGAILLLSGEPGDRGKVTVGPQVVTSVVTGAVRTVVVTPEPAPTQVPTAEPTPIPTLALPPSPTPAPNWDIPSLQARVTDFRFFEGGSEKAAYGERQYSTSFARSTTRYVYYELHLEYPQHTEAIDFDIEVSYYRSDGTILGQFTASHRIEADWTSSYHTRGWGWEEPSNWSTGTYLVELVVDGELIASDAFEIYE